MEFSLIAGLVFIAIALILNFKSYADLKKQLGQVPSTQMVLAGNIMFILGAVSLLYAYGSKSKSPFLDMARKYRPRYRLNGPPMV